MASFNKFNQLVQTFANGPINLATDVLKIMLTNTLPIPTNSNYSDVSATELANGNGYATGGASITTISSLQSSGIWKLIVSAATPTWTATGPMGPFRYVIMYDTTPALKPLIGWWDYGSVLTLTVTQPFTFIPDAINGIGQLQ